MGSQARPQERQPEVADGRSPLWRAHNGFRAIALIYATIWFCIQQDAYAHPNLALLEIVIMAGWTAFSVWQYSTRSDRTTKLVIADQILMSLLFLSSALILTDEQLRSGSPSVVSLWHASMVLVAAIRFGAVGGTLSGLFAAATDIVVRRYFDSDMALEIVLLVCSGLVVGFAADTARKATERLATALRTEAATAERERLARSIHDSVLQVLARVRHRGRELGGEAAELAHLAGEQEIALRSLIATGPTESPDSEESGDTAESDDTRRIDLVARLQGLRSSTTEVSVPGHPVELPREHAAALHSVAREALENVRKHAGADANAWVLLEDLGGEIVLSIRDDGPGIPEGRLDQASDEGRMGVAQSITGRVHGLGGTVTLDTAPGEGTEWEVQVPREGIAGSDSSGGSGKGRSERSHSGDRAESERGGGHS